MSSAEDMLINVPIFRHDLKISRQGEAGDAVYVVKDPLTRRFYRFGVAEWFIIRHLDGKTPPQEIRRKAEIEFGEELDNETLNAFVVSLHHRGLLERTDGERRQPMPASARARIRGNLLYLRFKTFDPDHLLDGLVQRVRFCFTPWFAWGSVVLIVLAFLTFLANTEELQRDIANIFSVKAIFAAWTIILLTTIVHEFAHGLTCKHFGGKVHEMGFLLIFFQPALYCNVSDAWLFPEKRKRLWVTIAGPYIDLVIWALAILAWRFFAPETLISYVSLVIVVTSGIRMIFNFIPLIKLDGYYLLSDWLEIPNLRKRAFAYLGAKVKRPWQSPDAELSRRERWIYLVYGALSLGFTVWLLSFIISLIAGFLIDRFQGTGFVLFSLLVLLFLRNPLARMLRRLRAAALPTSEAGAG
jgi:hypothetical protein